MHNKLMNFESFTSKSCILYIYDISDISTYVHTYLNIHTYLCSYLCFTTSYVIITCVKHIKHDTNATGVRTVVSYGSIMLLFM
jgi:hypothetical protein